MPVLCVWERKRGRRGLHTKSLESPEAPGAVMCRAVNWSWHSAVEKKKKKEEARTYKCVKGTKDEAVDAGPERKGTHTDRIISTSSVKSGQRSFIVTHSHMQRCCWSPHTEKDHPSQFLNSCAIMCSPRPPLPLVQWGFTQNQIHTLWNHTFYWITIFSRLNTPVLWSEFFCPRACKYYAHNLEILKAECCKDTRVNPLFAFYWLSGLSHTESDHLDKPCRI